MFVKFFISFERCKGRWFSHPLELEIPYKNIRKSLERERWSPSCLTEIFEFHGKHRKSGTRLHPDIPAVDGNDFVG